MPRSARIAGSRDMSDVTVDGSTLMRVRFEADGPPLALMSTSTRSAAALCSARIRS